MASSPPPSINCARKRSSNKAQGYFYLHRVDLHNELKHKATSITGAGIPVKLHTASAVTTVDCAAATIALADGRTLSGDLVIGADGIHSRTREAVTGKKYALESSGKACFRFLIPFNQLHDDPETRIFVENPGAGVQVTGPDSRHIVFYPCSDNTLVNVVAVVKKEMVGNIEQGKQKGPIECFVKLQTRIKLRPDRAQVGARMPTKKTW